jgi:hypothetical protein
MAQHDYNIANQGFPAFRTDLNNALSAIQTTNSGTSRPTGAVAGQLWLDTTSPTTPTLKYYDGADDISLATIDHSANTVNWLDSTVSVTGLTTTATGTVLTLSDSATTSTVNLIIDNDKEIRFREATANGTNYVSLSAPASLASDVTFTLPATDGTAGQALVTNGSGVLSFASASAGLTWDSSVKTSSTFTAVVNKGYFVDTSANAITCTLPASATAGDLLAFVDFKRTFFLNALTLNQNSLNFQGATSPNPVYNTIGQAIQLVYSGSTKGWIPLSDDDMTFETPNTASVEIDFLVIGDGGGGGGSSATFCGSGGGGAGSFRTSTQTLSAGTTITITVGGGGGGSSNENFPGGNGGGSSISGSGVTTITSAGGGGGFQGADASGAGLAGASGGGGAFGGAGGAGNTPSLSPSQGNAGGAGVSTSPNKGGGGGGGNSGTGSAGTGTAGGNGGNGTASSITGSSVTYCGGGGGGVFSSTAKDGGTGGTGGGGLGKGFGISGISGTANTGGGGGGTGGKTPSGPNCSGGGGGSGVVILSFPLSQFTEIYTGSPTITTSGTDIILTYTGSGTYRT